MDQSMTLLISGEIDRAQAIIPACSLDISQKLRLNDYLTEMSDLLFMNALTPDQLQNIRTLCSCIIAENFQHVQDAIDALPSNIMSQFVAPETFCNDLPKHQDDVSDFTVSCDTSDLEASTGTDPIPVIIQDRPASPLPQTLQAPPLPQQRSIRKPAVSRIPRIGQVERPSEPVKQRAINVTSDPLLFDHCMDGPIIYRRLVCDNDVAQVVSRDVDRLQKRNSELRSLISRQREAQSKIKLQNVKLPATNSAKKQQISMVKSKTICRPPQAITRTNTVITTQKAKEKCEASVVVVNTPIRKPQPKVALDKPVDQVIPTLSVKQTSQTAVQTISIDHLAVQTDEPLIQSAVKLTQTEQRSKRGFVDFLQNFQRYYEIPQSMRGIEWISEQFNGPVVAKFSQLAIKM